MFGLKVISKLNQKKYRQEYGCFIVEGKKGVMEAIEAGQKIIQLVMTNEFAYKEPYFAKEQEKLIIKENDFARLAETVTPSGIAAIIELPKNNLSLTKDFKTIAILEDIRDPGNFGTMIRTADWFGLDAILTIGGADPYQAKVVRSSMGSIFHLPIIQIEDVKTDLNKLKDYGFEIIVTRPELANDKQTKNNFLKTALVFGNESRGTSSFIDQLADGSLSIPKYGQAESLNVAVSFGILLDRIKR